MSERHTKGDWHAFPQPIARASDGRITDTGEYTDSNCGITMLDYFAARAMQSILKATHNEPVTYEQVADDSYSMALAMMEEGEKHNV